MNYVTIVVVAGIIAIAASIRSAAADALVDYGKHLSGECTTCHRDGSNETIPPIVGWSPDDFIAAMESYRNGERSNMAMVSVAKSLDAEQIKALAAYFATVKPKE